MATPNLFLLSVFGLLILSFGGVGIAAVNGTTIMVVNECPYTVWAAAAPGGGAELRSHERWRIEMTPKGSAMATRLWGRTGCTFDSHGHGNCLTGDCGGVLRCAVPPKGPVTVAEFWPQAQFLADAYDLSVSQGFNIPISIHPDPLRCARLRCDFNSSALCPWELKSAGGACMSSCTAYGRPEFCCTGHYYRNTRCLLSSYARLLKHVCPHAKTYADDHQNTFFHCDSELYTIVFCG